MASRVGTGVVLAALTLSFAACGSNTPPPEPESQPSTTAADEAHTGDHANMRRVFFVTPKEGETIKTDARVEFGSEMFTIAPVPPGEVADADVRPGIGHYHIAVDSDCLPAGQIIPKADPWVHFGTGANTADITLQPGTRRLTVQAGDDQHRTIEGLCETITVNVEG